MFKKLLLLVTLITTITVGQNITGAGTFGNPYIIYNAADFDSIRYLASSTKTWWKQNNDIDFTAFTFYPIEVSDLSINYDGQGHKLSNLTIAGIGTTYTGNYPAIFSRIKNTTIHDVTIEDFTLYYVGASYGTHNHFPAIIASRTNISGTDSVYNVKFIGCNLTWRSTSNITGAGASFLFPYNESTLIAYRVSIDSSNIYVEMRPSGGMSISFIQTDNAVLKESFITNSYIKGGRTNVGEGVISLFKSTTQDCYALYDTVETTVSANNFFGFWNYQVTSSQATNTTRNYAVGYTYNNKASNTKPTLWTGVQDYNMGNYNYADKDYGGTTTVKLSGAGTPTATTKTTVEMKTQATFQTFDFTTIWGIDPAIQDGYPYLLWAPPAANFSLSTPEAGDVYNPGDSLNITWAGDEDTVLFYYSLNSGTNYTFKDTIYNFFYNWDFITEGIAGTQVRVLITSLDSSLTSECHNFTIVPNFNLTYPNGGETFNGDEFVDITFDVSIDSLKLYYTIDNGATWIFIDSVSNIGTYNWDVPEATTSLAKIAIASLDSAYSDKSDAIFYIFSASQIINILSPLDSIATFTVGDNIDITIETVNIDSINIYYSINDSLNWIPIILDYAITNSYPLADTMTYIWNIPNIHGSIFLKASNILDTTTYVFNQTAYLVGNTMPAGPWVCWYNDNYFGRDLEFPSYSQTLFNYARLLDPSCGWTSSTFRHTAILNDDATGYDFFQEYMPWYDIIGNPLLPLPLYSYNVTDTTAIQLGSYYTFADTIDYRMRTYFYDESDSTLRCKDEVGNIDSIFVADLKSQATLWLTTPKLLLYNVQSSKISGQYIEESINLETLNDALFTPYILIGGLNLNLRGDRVYRIEALGYPPNRAYAEDVVRIFEDLAIRRDFFRGIDPKARKKGR